MQKLKHTLSPGKWNHVSTKGLEPDSSQQPYLSCSNPRNNKCLSMVSQQLLHSYNPVLFTQSRPRVTKAHTATHRRCTAHNPIMWSSRSGRADLCWWKSEPQGPGSGGGGTKGGHDCGTREYSRVGDMLSCFERYLHRNIHLSKTTQLKPYNLCNLLSLNYPTVTWTYVDSLKRKEKSIF